MFPLPFAGGGPPSAWIKVTGRVVGVGAGKGVCARGASFERHRKADGEAPRHALRAVDLHGARGLKDSTLIVTQRQRGMESGGAGGRKEGDEAQPKAEPSMASESKGGESGTESTAVDLLATIAHSFTNPNGLSLSLSFSLCKK